MAKKLGQRQASRRPPTGDPQGRRSPASATLVNDDRAWFPTLWQLRGSVVPAILPRVFVCSGVAAVVAALHQGGWSPVALPLAGLIPSIVLGLLLVFRTNTAYDRFWEGRKLWGTVTNESRNLARQIWWTIAAPDADAVAAKVVAVRTVAAYAYALKAHLRQAPLDRDAEADLPAEIAPTFATVQHRPMVLAAWLEQYLQTQVEQGHLDRYQRGLLTQSLNILVNSMGGCERILRTPMPYAYAIHLRQLLMIYCLLLPWEWVVKYGWWSVLLVTLIAFALLGIEEIGEEIENPFGHDPNDLPLDQICLALARSLEELMALHPHPAAGGVPRWVELAGEREG